MAKKKDLSPLDLDLIQCVKDGFGCHYGKWKATQEQKKIEPEQPNKFPVRICEYCCKEFTRKHFRPVRFCSDECRDSSYRKAVKERE